MIKITVSGISGRMGREIIHAAAECKDLKITAGLEISGHPLIGKQIDGVDVDDNAQAAISKGDCVVDFSNHNAALSLLQYMRMDIKPFISGSTGFSNNDIESIRKISQKLPVFIAPNMSLGINALYDLVKYTVKNLPDFDIEILETHHKLKKDAPSGTAKAIINLINTDRPDIRLISERNGIIGERNRNEIGVFAIRGGDVVGEHRVMFFGSGEFIELRHYATSRRCFAQGALAAVRFMHNRKPGFYTMGDLLKAQAGLTNK